MHISYDDASALDKQLEQLRKCETLKDNSRYLFDKLLHNDYRLVPERLGLDDLKILVSLREPEQSIKSIINLFAQKEDDHLYEQPDEAARYYIERVRWLAEFCGSSARGYYYFDAESVRRKPENLLSALTHWLGLEVPLSDRYNIFSQTGKPRRGDSSRRIRTGTIDKAVIDYSHVYVPCEELERALSTYRECRRKMIENAAGFIAD
jgi:hypothetical protein